MVKKEVDDDSREASSRRMKKGFAFLKDWMGICKLIDGSVEHNPFHQVIRKFSPKRFGSPSNKIAEEGANPRTIGGFGEVKMGEKVQGLLRR